MSRSIQRIIQSCSVQKTARKNTKYSRNETIFKIAHHAKVTAFAKILTLAQKITFKKACQNRFYKSFRVVQCKKPVEKTRNIPETRPFSKWAIMQRLQPLKNPYFGLKITIPKNMSKSIVHIIQSCSVQNTAQNTTKYSRNKTIFKMSHYAKAIAFAKCSLWLKK